VTELPSRATVTVPWKGPWTRSPADTTVSGSGASGSEVSLARTFSTWPAEFSGTGMPVPDPVSLTAFGASFTGLSVIVKVEPTDVSVPPPLSTAATVTSALPNAFGADVNVRVPDAETAGPAANRVELVSPVTE